MGRDTMRDWAYRQLLRSHPPAFRLRHEAELLEQVLRSLVLGARMPGPGTILPLGGLLLVVAACAVLVPALRAVRIDPAWAFRAE